MTQRPIKFRIAITSPYWDENLGSTKLSEPLTLGRIIDHEQIDFTDGGYLTWGQIDWTADTVRYLQFTGLLDSKGVEIYEGHILRGAVVGGMTYADKPPTFKVPSLLYFHWFEDLKDAIEEGRWIEIVGDIHTNPEIHCDY